MLARPSTGTFFLICPARKGRHHLNYLPTTAAAVPLPVKDNIYQTYVDEEAEKALQNSAASTSRPTVESNEGAPSVAKTSATSRRRHRDDNNTDVVPYPTEGVFMEGFIKNLLDLSLKICNPLKQLRMEVCFEYMVHYLDPQVTLPSRTTIATTLIPREFESAKAALFLQLKSVTYVSLTTDCWSSRRMESLMTVTLHFIVNGQFESRVLVTCPMIGSHKANNLSSKLETIGSEWGITEKVVCVVTDNDVEHCCGYKLADTQVQGKRSLESPSMCCSHLTSYCLRNAKQVPENLFDLADCEDHDCEINSICSVEEGEVYKHPNTCGTANKSTTGNDPLTSRLQISLESTNLSNCNNPKLQENQSNVWLARLRLSPKRTVEETSIRPTSKQASKLCLRQSASVKTTECLVGQTATNTVKIVEETSIRPTSKQASKLRRR
ncbi:Uncharacterized protein APZ42_012636 [Daphnia magna]|uniref:Uncharacterized protein n=1 Tax=Daphnia magna TaxID=35525 RepID=A0A162RLX3_9CRUS|nr:Uncharacterized protein APZ42_012636 [Daphnia magna]